MDWCPRCDGRCIDPSRRVYFDAGDDSEPIIITAVLTGVGITAGIFLKTLAEEAAKDVYAFLKRKLKRGDAVDLKGRDIHYVLDSPTEPDAIRIVDDRNRITIELPRQLPEEAERKLLPFARKARAADNTWLVISFKRGSWETSTRHLLPSHQVPESSSQKPNWDDASLFPMAAIQLNRIADAFDKRAWLPSKHEVLLAAKVIRDCYSDIGKTYHDKIPEPGADANYYIRLRYRLMLLDSFAKAFRRSLAAAARHRGDAGELEQMLFAIRRFMVIFRPVYSDIARSVRPEFVPQAWQNLEERVAEAEWLRERLGELLDVLTAGSE